MDYREINERNRARLQGQSGVYRVASELLLRGFNPQFPAVDCGADLTVEGGLRIQVKSGHLRSSKSKGFPYPSYWFKLTKGPTAHGNHGVRPRAPRVFSHECEFVVFWGIEQHRFWVVPSALLDNKSLVIVGPDIGWRDIDLDKVKQLIAQGMTYEQVAEDLGVSRETIARRLRGEFVEPVPSRSLTHKVRNCEGGWDAIRAAVDSLTEATVVAAATEEIGSAK